MTAKEHLQRAIDGLTEDEAADVLTLLAQPRGLEGETATRLLDSIPGAWEGAQRGLDDARAGRTTSLDDLRRAKR
jgi:hypothetical protein